MSAIDLHIGTQSEEDRNASLLCTIDNQPTLDAARACKPDLASTHNGLTRMLWLRRTLEDLLGTRSVHVADGETLGKGDARQRSRLFFVIDPPIRADEITWMPTQQDVPTVGLVGEAAKMGCPTWDLPAGSPLVGGSCPGATEGQSIVPLRARRIAERAAGVEVDLPETICQICYAEGGQYASPSVQVGELVRYFWARRLMESPEGRREFVETVARAIRGEMFPVERQIDPRTGRPVLPMRVHSSGDFFSIAYARCWVQIANALPEIVFWAPTRSWAAGGWNQSWPSILGELEHGNLIIRPSAYHTGDAAPSQHDHPWRGDYPYTSEGTTAIYKFDDGGSENGHSRDPRYDWACQTYAVVNDAASCRNAQAPDGETGCRACWLRPDLRVNYTAH